jgi:hypothetical protein
MCPDFQFTKSEAEQQKLAAEFEELQKKLIPLWQQIGRADPGGPLQEPNTVVIVPSLSEEFDVPASKLQAYEERFLFFLFLLRQPNIRLIFVTSQPVESSTIDYYLDTLPGVIISNARKRLFMVATHDGTAVPLSIKLLERPRLIEQIRSHIPDQDRAHIVPFNTTDLERELAVRLGIPMYGADPRHLAFGTKSGARCVFGEEGISYPLGVEDLFSEEALIEAVASIRAEKPAVSRVFVKHNHGVGGMGNAAVDLVGLPTPGDPAEQSAILERLRSMQFEIDLTYDQYLDGVVQHGAIVEEFIDGEVIYSPSAQLRISPLGEVEMLSTHDQILGGPTGQSYLGARFPARPEYSWLIMQEAVKVGQRLAREGIVGRFAVDFVVAQDSSGEWAPYAIEVNLRKGGTTAPFLILQYLTDGMYHAEKGIFLTCRDDEKYYVSSDHVEDEAYRVFNTDMLFDIVSRHRLHYDHSTQTGIILHMLRDVATSGQFGVTAVADSHEKADALYQRFLDILDEEALVAKLEVLGAE